MNLGLWVNGVPGTVLTREGEPVEQVVYLAEGCVAVHVSGVQIAECGPGNFVGEMSVVGDTRASATTTISEASRLWRIKREKLSILQDTDPELASALDIGIARDMRHKIIASNKELSGNAPA